MQIKEAEMESSGGKPEAEMPEDPWGMVYKMMCRKKMHG